MVRLQRYVFILCMALSMMMAVPAGAQSTVSLSSSSGHPGDEVEVSVMLSNAQSATALQINIPHSPYLSYVDGSAVLNTQRVSGSHCLSVSDKDNLLNLYVYDLSLNTFQEGTGAFMTFRLKLGKDDEIPQLTLSNMLKVKSEKNEEGDKIAVYYAYGSIVDNSAMDLLSGGGHNIVGKTTAEDLRKLADDEDIKAVVFRVNSGGGSAVASEQIRHAVKLLKAKKPVVVSMGGAAASGGYWISSPANFIYAEPTTITGSIGIFGMVPNFSGLVTDKLGITFDGVKTNKYTDAEENLVLAKDNADEMKHLQGHIDRGYISFLNIVSEGRGMKPEEVDSIAQGRVWLATDAVKIKLVDKLGSLDDAIKKAAELAKVKDFYTVTYPGKGDWMDNLFPKENKGTYLDGERRLLLGDLYQPLMEIRQTIKDGSRIQARMLEDIRVK